MKNINFNAKNTAFAPAVRGDMITVQQQYKSVSDVELIDQVFAKIPLKFQILNNDRQIIYINELLKNDLKEKGIDLFLGYRTGEVMGCKNSFISEGGCGTSNHCQHCSVIGTILKARKQNTMVSGEVIFESKVNGKTETTIYEVVSKPFLWKEETYVIITFKSLNDKKRKEQLERTFFHDLMNKVSSISGLSELLEMEESKQNNDFVKMIKRGIYDLADEIRFQKNIMNAENDELVVYYSDISSKDLLIQMKEDFYPYHKISHKNVLIHENDEDIVFKSDSVLVKRTLTNLIKNALEAVKINETVTIGSKRKDNSIVFWVQNNVVLKEEIKEKIFKRTFSTKGEGRGIGTYSVKMFTEKYLNGKAYFTSDEENGTIFSVEYPIDQQ